MKRSFSAVFGTMVVLVGLAGCGSPLATSEPARDAGTPPPIPDSGMPVVLADVLGALDRVDASGLAAGWAISRAAGIGPASVALYADGDNLSGKLLGTVSANLARGDVNTATGLVGDHGFSLSMPKELHDGLAHTLSAYARTSKETVRLSGSPLSFTLAAPACSTAGPRVAHTAEEYEVTLQASSGKSITALCGGDEVGTLELPATPTADWESFYVLPRSDGTVSIRSSHGRYLTAESAGGAALHANRPVASTWEIFQLSGTLTEGAAISLKTADNQHYVSARSMTVDATATAIGVTEQFKVHVIFAPSPVSVDAIDLSQVTVVNSPADVASWPVTTKITTLQMQPSPTGLSFSFPAKATWPDYTPPGWDGPLQYTVWAVVKVGGSWYTSGFIQMWAGRASTGAPILTDFAQNWAYDGRWGAMMGHVPQVGEQMGFFLTAGNARGIGEVTSLRERSNVVLVSLPAGDNGVFNY